MELPLELSGLPPQCYSPSPDQGLEGRRGEPTSRQPLEESTSNVQDPHTAWYAQHLEALSSITQSIPAPSVLRTQSFGSEYGTPAFSKSQQRHELHLHGRRRLQGTNPLMPLLTQAFQNYRKKQADKPDQKWPDVLEGPFLDALILIPQMKRKKYTMRQTLFGRNMLIGEYLWIAYCQTLPPGAEPDLQMVRERKKVSSHIQVLKNFFSNHRCFHFFFRSRNDDKEEDSAEAESLKNNPVLIALSEGRLPDERPNYEYYSQILALNDQVQFRPRRCWIFVSHEDAVVRENGSAYIPATGDKLRDAEYPHLLRNLERDSWTKEEQQTFKGALLHEFTKEMHQVESSSVTELSKKWESTFPDLHQRLKDITSTSTDARCDILHMHSTLELKEKCRFPGGSRLSSWVEIDIEQPRLLNHRWKVDTRLVRPSELARSHDKSASEVLFYEQSKEFSVPYQHQPGCDGPRNEERGHCGCISQRSRRDVVAVPFPLPFPADMWALTLTSCAEYPAHPSSGSKKYEKERGSRVKAEDGIDEGPRSRRRGKQPTQMELVPKIAMMQEIWSRPPISAHEQCSDGSEDQRWTRRGVILWTFETIHSIEKGKLVTAQGGKTNWRFLTILDPTGEYHQRHAIVNTRKTSGDDHRERSISLASSRPVSRQANMSPNPPYQQLRASMSENFASTWDNAGALSSLTSSAAQAAYAAHFMSQQIPITHTPTTQSGYGLLDSFSSHSGLATPPPSASHGSSFAQSFDSISTSPEMMPCCFPAHVAATTAGIGTGSHSLGGPLPAVTDPLLAHVGNPYDEAQEAGMHGWSGPGVGGGIDSAAPWSSGYSGASGVHGHDGAVGWPGSQPRSRRGSQHQIQSQPDSQAWIVSTCIIDEQISRTSMASANTPARTLATRTSSHDRHSSTTPRETSQEWVHIHGSLTASTSDLSHDWEDIRTLPGTELSSPPTSAGGMQLKHHLEAPVVCVDGQVKSLKRARSESVRAEAEYRVRKARS
ncbi:hypothetical protein VTI74DRAFT_902 [Chaetomium olivicolor]